MGATHKPPKKEKDFIAELKKAFGSAASISSVPSTQKVVNYCVELRFKDNTKIIRVFCSNNCTYWAIVQGSDFSLAPIVFDSFKVTK
jgi:hypothetical protein